ncbi:MAG: DHHA1 domain-containing protein [Nitrososphaeria archaeon]
MNVIISHSADLDGVSSAALLIRKFMESGEPYLVYLRDYSDGEEVYPTEITRIPDVRVYIADVSTHLKHIDAVVNRIKLTKGRVEWTDHHETTEEIKRTLISAGVELYHDKDSGSASVLVEKRYELRGEIYRQIADAGFQADTLKIKDDYVKALVDLIDYFNYLEKRIPRVRLERLAVQIAIKGPSEVVKEDDYVELLKHYRDLKQKALEEVLETVRIYDLHGYKLAIAYATSLVSGTQAASKLEENVSADLYLIIKDEGGMSFRRSKACRVNLVPLANIFGGGGHEYAAGADLGRTVARDEFNRVADEVYERIRSGWRP